MATDLDLLTDLLDDDEVFPDEAALIASVKEKEVSEIHKGDTDSSDDEDNKYFESANYNSFGRSVKNRLKEENASGDGRFSLKSSSWKKSTSNNESTPTSSFCLPAKAPVIKGDVYTEPIFGIRLINPIISSHVLKERMAGKAAVTFSKVKRHVAHGDLKNDWVIGGVVVSKSNTKVSQKGSKYVIWRLSDLKDGLMTVSLFLFGNSYTKLWKTNVGCVIGVLNPNVLDNKDKSSDEATLSIFNPDQVMIWGQSKDFGTCKGKRKNGENCFNFVNLSQCEFCVHHVQTEYRKFTGRSELQSPTCGGLTNLRNKVLGKNEVFYGGRSFTALTPPTKSKVVQQRDNIRLNKLGVDTTVVASVTPGQTSNLPHCPRTVELLKKLHQADSHKKENAVKSKTTADNIVKKNFCLSKSNNKLGIDIRKSNTPKLTTFPLLSDPSLDKKSSPSLALTKNQKAQNPSRVCLQNRFNAISNLVLEKPDPDGEPVTAKLPKEEKLPKPLVKSRGSALLSSAKTDSEKFMGPLKVSPKTAQNPVGAQKLPPLVQRKQNGSTPEPKCNSTAEESVLKVSPKNVPQHQDDPSAPIQPKSLGSSLMLSVKSPPMGSLAGRKNSRVSLAKKKALEYIKKNGPINNSNKPSKGVKRLLESSQEGDSEAAPEADGDDSEKKMILSERFIELMNRPPVNPDLIELNDMMKLDEYYGKMEKKEQMEEKMLNTFKLACKAVKCLKCKYTWFSASDRCKSEGHPLKVVDGEKRFFKCGKCGNRTVSLSIIPLISCRNCGGSNWLKAPMIKEKVNTPIVNLSIRGGEQKFVNSVITDANLDLLVAED